MRKTGIQRSAKRVQATHTVTDQRLVHHRVTRPPVTPPAFISLKFFKVGFDGIDDFFSWITMKLSRFTLLNPDAAQQPVALITHKREHCCMQKVVSTKKLQIPSGIA